MEENGKGEQMMRKYVIGGLVGFLLAIPFTSFGAEIQSMIGKKVENVYPVVVDGKQLDKKAISIDGTTYAPLRSIADATGYGVSFESNTVTFESQTIAPTGGETVEPTPTAEPVQTPATTTTEDQIKALEKERDMAVFEQGAIRSRNTVAKPLPADEQSKLDALTAKIKDLQTQIDALKAQP